MSLTAKLKLGVFTAYLSRFDKTVQWLAIWKGFAGWL